MRKNSLKWTMTLAIVALMSFNGGITSAQENGETAPATETGAAVVQETVTIAKEIAGDDEFATLNAAIQAAGLDEALSGEGPFTIFAPNEEAFKKVEAAMLEDLLKGENKEKLIALLKAHVASGEWTAEKISEVSEIPTVDGGSLTVTRQDDKLMVGSATVDSEKSVKCENGLLHCIDEVLPAN